MHILLKLCMFVKPEQHIVGNGHCANQMVFQRGCKQIILNAADSSEQNTHMYKIFLPENMSRLR